MYNSLFCLPIGAYKIFKRYNTILVVAEHNNTVLNPITRNAITAAKKIGGEVSVLVAGTSITSAVEALSKASGIKTVFTAENEAFNGFSAESLTPLIVATQKEINASHIMAGASTFGKNLIPRVAMKLDASPISDVVGISGSDTFKRPIYAGNAFQTIQALDKVKVFSIRGTNFEADPLTGGSAPTKPAPEGNYKTDSNTFMGLEIQKRDTPDLTTAKIVLSGGRGMGSAENFKILYALAKKMHAAVGASRAAVDAGYVPNDLQIGQTGKIVAPELYMAFGISGAIQHVAGIKDSRTIVAVNKDADAPIFQIADYGLVSDLFKVISELSSKI